MAVANRQVHRFQDVHLYDNPNPAITEILVGPRLRACVTDYTNKVFATFVGLEVAAPYRDPNRRYREGGHPPGRLIRKTKASVEVGGFKNDRIVGTIRSRVIYAGSDEHGRSKYAQYKGKHNLRTALYSTLPQRFI